MRIKKFIRNLTFGDDLLHLIYPSSCLVCELELSKNDHKICSFCLTGIKYTDFHLFEETSDMDKLFWGRVQVHATYAHFYFQKNDASQKILFNLKYKHDSQIGEWFGEEIGTRIKNLNKFKDVDLIVPIPLHYKKAFIRGYNQSEKIANGIAQQMNAPVNTSISKRVRHSSTQTKKNRFQRWENVNEIFSVRSNIQNYKHVILVDDVITTGATTESLIRTILKTSPQIKISVVTLAIA